MAPVRDTRVPDILALPDLLLTSRASYLQNFRLNYFLAVLIMFMAHECAMQLAYEKNHGSENMCLTIYAHVREADQFSTPFVS
jgi:hypothetical protein